jgi:hypothetical protein
VPAQVTSQVACAAPTPHRAAVSKAPQRAISPEEALRTALGGPVAHAPLDTPLVLNGGFGEFRSNHFHAGLDLGTGGQTGRPVYAPLAGWIERVRASGVGYGRSLYLHTDDGRLFVFGHLDAYAEPIASYVGAVQESTGQYEQDLWPEGKRFRYAAGQVIAWSGESGAGHPHLHVEIRRGDIAYNPLRAGIAIRDTSPPVLPELTLEPLDDASWVERGAAPYSMRLGARPETVLVEGRVRVMVAARDGVWRGVDRMVPWSVAMEFGDQQVEARFDSVSWATDMVESDYVYDTGRIVGDKDMVLWSPRGYRPHVITASAPLQQDAGTLVVRADDPPRPLRLIARDVSGHSLERTVVLRPPGPGESGPDTSKASPGDRASATWHVEYAALPGGYLRAEFDAAPSSSRGVWLDAGDGGPKQWASLRGRRWSAIVPLALADHVTFRGRNGGGLGWEHPFLPEGATLATSLTPGALFETTAVIQLEEGTPEVGKSLARELSPVGLPVRTIEPASIPIRKATRISFGGTREFAKNQGIYRRTEEGWDYEGGTRDSSVAAPNLFVETRHLGSFAVLADTMAPRVTPLRPHAKAETKPYSKWALQARIGEAGSGVDSRATYFEVDGKRMPSEWDSEEGILRWRPRRPPGKGEHHLTVVAMDRAGNARRVASRFVVK